jgi:ubiquitin C-terminal hydrolase
VCCNAESDEMQHLVTWELQHLYQILSQRRRRAFIPVSLIKALGVDISHMQDAHEFLVLMLQSLRVENAISECIGVCGVSLLSTTTCRNCENASRQMKWNTVIQLNIRDDFQSLDGLLHDLSKPEEISGYQCNSCVSRQSALLQYSITDPGQWFFVNVVRFIHDAEGIKKDMRHVMLSPTIELCGIMYKLRAVIFHQGSANVGHYVAVVKDGDVWYLLNDDAVRVTSWPRIGGGAFGEWYIAGFGRE